MANLEYIYKKVLIGLPAEWDMGGEGRKDTYAFDFACKWMMVLFTERGNVGNNYLLIQGADLGKKANQAS